MARALHALARVTHTVRRRFPIGAELVEGGVHFRLWAPAHARISLVLESERREVQLRPEGDGYHALLVDNLRAGARYRFRLGDEATLHADPASRYQPEGPFGPSQVIDPDDTAWTDAGWHGITRPHEQVVYEMHVGTFTPQGTWTAAAEQLPFLHDVGITTIELMPINDFAGRHGWGYDGVNMFAPYRQYGTPEELRMFIDRAHALEIAVILDVVYNHFGPAGNSHYAFTPDIKAATANDWGDELDYSRPGTRELFLTNAVYWIREFHFDGLRIDATHAIRDTSERHILTEITEASRAAAGDRTIWMVGENESQDVSLVKPIDQGGSGLDALWNDDFEHSARVALTGCTEGYFHDYAGTPQELVSALERGFLYQGQVYAWQRNTRGSPTTGLPPSRFVNFLENHDQVANFSFGDRLTVLTDAASLRAMTAVLLLGPQIPMLFQGQEHGSRRPFQYFVDHDDELNRLVREGRASFLKQFARLATPEAQAALPIPGDPTTFARCVLDPAERTFENPSVQLHRDLLRVRREHPCFTQWTEGGMRGAVLGDHTFCVRWFHADGDRLLLVNLGK